MTIALASAHGALTKAANLAAGHLTPLLVPMEVCPKAPPGAQKYADEILGYVMWGVGALFIFGLLVSIGAIVAGRVFHMPHASKAGVVGIFIVIMAVLAYLIAPGIITSMLGNGCI